MCKCAICGGDCKSNSANALEVKDTMAEARRNEYYNYRERCLDQGVEPLDLDTWIFNEYGE